MTVEVDALGEKRHALLRKLENAPSPAIVKTPQSDKPVPQMPKPSSVRANEEPNHRHSSDTKPDRPSRFPQHSNRSHHYRTTPDTHRQTPKRSSLADTPSSHHSSLGGGTGSTRTPQSINGVNVTTEDPLDVRIRNLLHPSTSSSSTSADRAQRSKPEATPKSHKTPLLPTAFPAKPKPAPLLRNPPPTPVPLLPSPEPSFSRRTLLPTPMHEMEQHSEKASPHEMRQPLLQTPSSSDNQYTSATKLAAETSMRFLCELRDIIQKDLERRLIEGHAFAKFAKWWETQQSVSGNLPISMTISCVYTFFPSF